jgi:phosphopantetheine adenylyltransferase/dephospho-CoA kinase
LTVISLTGGIASGKSFASAYLGEKGAHLIDADKVGHRAYEPDTQAFAQVVAEFGEDVVSADGQIDRKVLGGKVFAEEGALTRLTDIVWPEIRRLAEADIAANLSANPDQVVVLEAAVLFEAGWDDIGDEVWVITVDPETAITRATARDGVDREAVQQRIDAQLSNEERANRAGVVISNDGTEAELLAALDAEWARLGG